MQRTRWELKRALASKFILGTAGAGDTAVTAGEEGADGTGTTAGAGGTAGAGDRLANCAGLSHYEDASFVLTAVWEWVSWWKVGEDVVCWKGSEIRYVGINVCVIR